MVWASRSSAQCGARRRVGFAAMKLAKLHDVEGKSFAGEMALAQTVTMAGSGVAILLGAAGVGFALVPDGAVRGRGERGRSCRCRGLVGSSGRAGAAGAGRPSCLAMGASSRYFVSVFSTRSWCVCQSV